ncbi:efflux RND transporter periplasmic adaptor subunit [Paenimyroides baculatum]|uniref:Efflux RND transporter periplasmic adaptor subunit n=1 Tax=Paenimyroides baculatum TaxID=2608000 RepID=A0A5M6C975_9FLAO|nr:efflux RND transporter periplasmic adaptor subunit [Paenimyroides baculatum]KAA5531644.1 efflux RND transporter periplasmic adaptor subunit [Paenimyroides baculatum]
MKYLFIICSALFMLSCKKEAVIDQTLKPASPITQNELVLTKEQLKSIELSTVKMEKKQVSGTLQLNGKVDVDPDSKVSISSALGGHVKSVRVLPGKSVKKGDVIVIIEDNQFIEIQQDYLTTQAQLLSAAPNYNRQKELNISKSTSDKLMQQAETEYKSLLAVKNGLEEKLRLLNINPSKLSAGKIQRSISIVAPFSGIVSHVNVNKGKYVAPSDELVELINPQGLILKIKVFEKDLPKIAIGQNVTVFTNGNEDTKFNAKIVTKGNSILEDGSTEVIAKVVNLNSELVNGLYINALIDLENIDAFTLPEDAVVSFEGKNYVFEQIASGKFRMTEVQTGTTNGGWVSIQNHSSLINKSIVGKGAYALLMALKNKTEE